MNTKEYDLLPYEKALRFGFDKLSDKELLAILIRSGTKTVDCMTAADNVIEKLKGHQLLGLYDLSLKQLMGIPGIGQVKAVQLKSICELSKRIARQSKPERIIFDSDEAVSSYFMEELRHLENEELHALFLDTKCTLISEETVSKGTINSSIFPTREIAKLALAVNAINVILIHNHPSGDSTPSNEDIYSTRMVKEGLKMVGIYLIDHIIIGDNNYASLKRDGFLND